MLNREQALAALLDLALAAPDAGTPPEAWADRFLTRLLTHADWPCAALVAPADVRSAAGVPERATGLADAATVAPRRAPVGRLVRAVGDAALRAAEGQALALPAALAVPPDAPSIDGPAIDLTPAPDWPGAAPWRSALALPLGPAGWIVLLSPEPGRGSPALVRMTEWGPVRAQFARAMAPGQAAGRFEPPETASASAPRGFIEAALEALPVRLFLKGLDLRYQACNAALAADVGLASPAAVVGLSDFDLYAPEQAEAFQREDRRVIDSGQASLGRVIEVRSPRGVSGWQRVSKVPARGADGRVAGVIGVYEDVTEPEQTRRALEASERRYRFALQTTVDAININRLRDGVYIDCSRGFFETTGYSREEVIGRSSLELGIWVDPDVRMAMADALRDTGLCREIEARFRKKNGDIMWGLFSASLMELDGEPCVFSITRDITAAKAAQQELDRYRGQLERLVAERTAALRESQERLELAMDASTDGLWDWDLVTGTSQCNPAYFRMLGYAPGDLSDRTDEHWLGLMHPDDRARLGNTPQRLLAAQGHYALEFRMRARDGTDRWILSRGKVVRRDAEGRPVRAVGTHTDITEHKRAEQTLREAKEAAEAASVAKTAFLANMSHEIRTPLNAIMGMAYLVRGAGLSAQQAERMGKLERAAAHLLEIINAILDLSKIESDRIELEETPIDVDRIAASVLSMLGDEARAKGLAIRMNIEPSPVALLGDATRILQALVNYVSNAIKFTPAGSVTVRARTEAVEGGRATLRFEVEDTGIGVEAEALERLFEPFEQADNSTTRRYGGTGLGLAIVRRLARLMGGEAGGGSRPGGGSRFWFTVRLRVAGEPSAGLPDEAPRSAADHLARRHTGRRVLVVDDEPVGLEIVGEILARAGLAVETAASGHEAIARVAREPFDLVVMDVQMPGLDGLDTTRSLRGLPHGARVPIVALTANAFAEDRERCLAAGMDDFLSKPVDPDHLYRVVEDALTRSLEHA